MKVFLAEAGSIWKGYMPEPQNYKGVYLLQSFFYADGFSEKVLIPQSGDFLLDSGAFTFMQSSKSHCNWDKYIEKYAEFINRNKIKKYFELDIDSVVGYEKVKEYRKRLEDLTGVPSIPVWHNNRGKEEFVKMCEEYPYVAIGGLVGGNSEYSKKYWKFFPWFINTAHEHGAKIHALGFTSLEGIAKYHFDSVDSTAWTSGNRFNGVVYHFDGKKLQTIQKPANKRVGDHSKIAKHNFSEWVKFQKYAEKNL